MRRSLPLLVLPLSLSLLSSLSALTVPAEQDTNTTVTAGVEVIKACSGKRPSTVLGPGNHLLVNFALSDPAMLPGNLEPNNVGSATLQFYVQSVKNPGTILVRAVSSGWSETTNSAAPTLGSVVASIPGTDLVAKNFVSVDVSGAVVDQLTSGNDFGFALETTNPTTRVILSSKEGVMVGACLRLEINANPWVASPGSGNFYVGLAAGNLAAGANTLASATTGSGNVGLGTEVSAGFPAAPRTSPWEPLPASHSLPATTTFTSPTVAVARKTTPPASDKCKPGPSWPECAESPPGSPMRSMGS